MTHAMAGVVFTPHAVHEFGRVLIECFFLFVRQGGIKRFGGVTSFLHFRIVLGVYRSHFVDAFWRGQFAQVDPVLCVRRVRFHAAGKGRPGTVLFGFEFQTGFQLFQMTGVVFGHHVAHFLHRPGGARFRRRVCRFRVGGALCHGTEAGEQAGGDQQMTKFHGGPFEVFNDLKR